MFDANQARELSEWIGATVKQLNADLADATTEEALATVVDSAEHFVQRLTAERTTCNATLAVIEQRLAQGRQPWQGKTAWAKLEAELQEEIGQHRVILAALDAQVGESKQFATAVRAELAGRSRRLSGSVVKEAEETLSHVALVAPTNRGRRSRLGIIGGVGLAALVGLGALSIRPPSSPAPAPTAAATVMESATEAADLWTKTPLPTDTAEPVLQTAPTATETSMPTATPEPTATPTPLPVAAKNANLRGGPGTNYPIVGGVIAGQELDIVGRNRAGDWYHLRNGAWIATFLVQASALDVPVVSVIPTLSPPTATRRPPTATSPPVLFSNPVPPASSACCKRCGPNSQPCGDSCIALRYTCHKGPGCACW